MSHGAFFTFVSDTAAGWNKSNWSAASCSFFSLFGHIFFIHFCFFSGHFSGSVWYLYWFSHSQFQFYDIWLFNLQWKCHILTFEPSNLSIPQTVHLMYSLYINMWTFLLDFTTVVGQSNSGGKATDLINHAHMLWCSWTRHRLPQGTHILWRTSFRRSLRVLEADVRQPCLRKGNILGVAQ